MSSRIKLADKGVDAGVGVSTRVESLCKVNIKFFGPIIGILGRSQDHIMIEKGKTKVSDLINALCSRYGQQFRELAIHNGHLNRGLIIFINGVNATDLSQELEEADQIHMSIASQMAGG